MARWTSRRFSTSFRSARVSLVGQKDGEPLGECPWPPPLPFMCAARRGPTSLPRAGRPRSGRESKDQLAVGPTGGDQSNILPLDLTLSFNLSQSFLSSFLILYLPIPSWIIAYEHASSSRSIADGLNSYNAPLCFEIDTLTLDPLLSGKHRLYHKPMSTVCSLYTLGGKPFS